MDGNGQNMNQVGGKSVSQEGVVMPERKTPADISVPNQSNAQGYMGVQNNIPGPNSYVPQQNNVPTPNSYIPNNGFAPAPGYIPSSGTSTNPNYVPPRSYPEKILKTKRGLIKYIIFCIITLGIYNLVVFTKISNEVNFVCTKHDNDRTMPYLLMLLLCPITLGIVDIVWYHKLSNRIGAELKRRGVPYSFGGKHYWLWNVLGIALCGVGPFVYHYKLFKASNLMNKDYNQNG